MPRQQRGLPSGAVVGGVPGAAAGALWDDTRKSLPSRCAMKSSLVLLAAGAVAAGLLAPMHASPYTWVDERGTVHYSQFPPKRPPKTQAASAPARARQTESGAPWDAAAHARWEKFMDAGMEAFEEGRYAEAEKSLQAAVKEAERYGSRDSLGASLGLLARTYQRRAQYAKAEPLYRRSLAVLEPTLGPEGVTQEVVDLIKLYLDQGKYPQAQRLYPRLAVTPDAAEMLRNLAASYERQGQYGKAETLYRHRVAMLEKALGPADSRLGSALIDLAKLSAKQGRPAEAEPVFKRALAIQEKALGPEHPNVASTLDRLATVYRDQGKFGEAEPLYQRAVAIYWKTLGPEHPNVAGSLGRYALLLRKTERQTEAATMEAQAKAILAKRGGGS